MFANAFETIEIARERGKESEERNLNLSFFSKMKIKFSHQIHPLDVQNICQLMFLICFKKLEQNGEDFLSFSLFPSHLSDSPSFIDSPKCSLEERISLSKEFGGKTKGRVWEEKANSSSTCRFVCVMFFLWFSSSFWSFDFTDGKPIPSHLREYEADVRNEMELEDVKVLFLLKIATKKFRISQFLLSFLFRHKVLQIWETMSIDTLVHMNQKSS